MGRDVKIWRGLFFGWLIVGGAYVQDYFLGGLLWEELLSRIYGISISASKNPLAQHPATNAAWVPQYMCFSSLITFKHN